MKKDDETGQTLLGAAIYNQSEDIIHYIDENGAQGSILAGILRCESSAIRQAIRLHVDDPETLNIFTDSLVSLHLIRRTILESSRMHISKHRDMFASIADLLEQRASRGYKTSLNKVKSHCSDTPSGNTKVDAAAGRVAEGIVTPTIVEDISTNPYANQYWLQTRDGHDVSDLNRGIKRATTKLTWPLPFPTPVKLLYAKLNSTTADLLLVNR
jgi:hypothetical protein